MNPCPNCHTPLPPDVHYCPVCSHGKPPPDPLVIALIVATVAAGLLITLIRLST